MPVRSDSWACIAYEFRYWYKKGIDHDKEHEIF